MRSFFEAGLQFLATTGPATIQAHREYAIWRHQLIGQPNPLADNAAGIDPYGFTWKTIDIITPVTKQGFDGRGRTTIYMDGVEPVQGDLLVMLKDSPQSKEQAANSTPVKFYRVKDTDTRRAPTGKIVYSLIFVEPDYSGQWKNEF